MSQEELLDSKRNYSSIKRTREKKVPEAKTYTAPALEKGLDIIELLSQEPDGLTQREIALKLNRTIGEIFRMLSVLHQRGYLKTGLNDDRYTLTHKLLATAQQFSPLKRLTHAANEKMKELAFEIEQSCHLVIYYEGMGHIILQQDPPSERILTVRLGAKASLLNSCSGHVLLAFANENQQKQMLVRAQEYTSDSDNYTLDLERIRTNGFEVIESQQALGVTDIGFPIFDFSSSVVAALVVPYFELKSNKKDKSLEDCLPIIQTAANSISNELGFVPSQGIAKTLELSKDK